MANGFKKVSGVFFRETDEGLSAVSDPQTLGQLQAGELDFQEQEGLGTSKVASQPTGTIDPEETQPSPEPPAPEDAQTGTAEDEERRASGALSDADSSTGRTQALLNNFIQSQQREREAIREERQQAEQQRGKLLNQFRRQQEEAPSAEETRSRAREELGIPEGFTEEQFQLLQQLQPQTQQLRDRLANLQDQRAQAMQNLREEGGLQPTFDLQRSRLMRDFAAQESAIAARVQANVAKQEAVQGNIQLARGLINDVVDQITFEQRQRREDLQFMLNFYDDEVSDLRTEEQRNLQNSLNTAFRLEEIARAEKQSVMELMVENPGAGIDVNDSMEEAIQKAGQAATQQEARSQAVQTMVSKLVNRGTTQASVIQESLSEAGFDVSLEEVSNAVEFATTGADEFEFKTIGNELVQINPLTGEAQTIFEGEDDRLFPTGTPTSFAEYQLAGGEGGTGQSFSEFLERKNAALGGNLLGEGGLTPEQMEFAIDLGNDVTSSPVFKDMTDVQTGLVGVYNGLSQENGFGDIAAINAFQRMIDPGATVRSEDVTLLQSANSFFESLNPEFLKERLREGDKLPEPVRDRMRTLSRELYEARRESYEDLAGKRFRALAEQTGVSMEFIGGQFKPADEVIGGGNTMAVPPDWFEEQYKESQAHRNEEISQQEINSAWRETKKSDDPLGIK